MNGDYSSKNPSTDKVMGALIIKIETTLYGKLVTFTIEKDIKFNYC